MSGTARGENWKNTGPHFLGETDYFIIGLWGWIQPPASLPSRRSDGGGAGLSILTHQLLGWFPWQPAHIL